MRFLGKILLGVSLIAVLIIAALPWAVYLEGLQNIEGRPTPSSNSVGANDFADLRHYLRGRAIPSIESLSPWTYTVSLAFANPAPLPGADIAWIIARHYNSAHLKSRGIMWHVSGAALTIWITRNWTREQILATAADIARSQEHASSLGVRQQNDER